ncbi:hypothetical protein [Pendulispora albinea]|uniref:SIS domain-containing protein n=1 Tax=Pendulispora albinea TaxID=2741071 RepID=A0ABZ2LVU7_9BACT
MLTASAGCEDSKTSSSSDPLLDLLGVTPTDESIDYVKNKTQFQLHTLKTEQRHPRTWTLSERAPQDLPGGLDMLFSVDDDIAQKVQAFVQDSSLVRKLSDAIEKALLERRKIYVYGTGATGRLAKEMESTFWRPYWRKIDGAIKAKLEPHLGSAIEERLIGEMTGADRALISSLEGFEDLQLIGRLQLKDHGITKGDVVIEVTEGGETSAGIGTVLGAHDQWKEASGYDAAEASKYLFFLYNNPDDVLLPFDRSRSVIQEAGITKVNLTTGPQAITGSTRMQATTIETFILAHAAQDAVGRVLRGLVAKGVLTTDDLARLGFAQEVSLEKRLEGFAGLLAEVKKTVPNLAKLTQLEADTYRDGHFSTYFANRGLITVFIDGTERSPTFRLAKLDRIDATQRQSWFQVWTPAKDKREAWQAFLGRPFHGLKSEIYRDPFAAIEDTYLRGAALRSLTDAGDEQQDLYDFSFSDASIQRTGPKPGDLGVMIAVDDESSQLADSKSEFDRFAAVFDGAQAKLGLVVVGAGADPEWRGASKGAPTIHIQVGNTNDPFGVDQQIALKMLLNAHSTAIMARLGKVVGNTMTNVSPSNLKLIGRATYLIKLHVDDVFNDERWQAKHGKRELLSYAQANAVLYDVIPYVKDKQSKGDQSAAEVSLAIVRILESLRLGRRVSHDEALDRLKNGGGLNGYLANVRTQ